MAEEVFSINPLSELSDHKYICAGIPTAGSRGLEGISIIKATIPIINNGAVSPMALANPIIVPVSVPGIAKGNT